MIRYTVQYVPTGDSPAEAQRWTDGRSFRSQKAAEHAANEYLAQYAYRRQIAEIVEHRLVATLEA